MMAAAVLLASVASVTFYNDWKKEAEIRAIAMGIVSEIASMDLKSLPNSTEYFLPSKPYKIFLSTEYVSVVRNDGTFRKNISVVKKFLVKPFVSCEIFPWKDGKEFHNYLLEKYGSAGNISDPIPYNKISEVKTYLNDKLEEIAKKLAITPFQVDATKPLHIEKIFIYFEKDGRLKSISILIVSQEVT